jgi:hypothetical protein
VNDMEVSSRTKTLVCIDLMLLFSLSDLSPVRWRRKSTPASRTPAAPSAGGPHTNGEKTDEKRNPLLERVKNTKLSCFRSLAMGRAGTAQKGRQGPLVPFGAHPLDHHAVVIPTAGTTSPETVSTMVPHSRVWQWLLRQSQLIVKG